MNEIDDDYVDTNYDCVLGVATSLSGNPSPITNNDATIMSLIHADLLAMWASGDLTLDAVLDTIEEFGNETAEDAIGWMEIQYLRVEFEREPVDKKALELVESAETTGVLYEC